jgi:hypothetical protein
MATSGEGSLTLDEFRFLIERAGLSLSQDELENLKPLYDLYMDHIKPLYAVDFKAEEIGVSFHPDWPSQ